MSTVSSFRRPVKSTRLVARPANHKFGAGVLASLPSYRAEFTASDAQWWAAEQASREDRHFDRLADEAAFLDRYTRGLDS